MRRFDLASFLATLTLLVLGLTIIRSVSISLFPQQLVFISVAICLYLALSKFDFRFFSSLFLPLYIISIVLLLSTFAFGIVSRGAQRWIQVGAFSFQPSEFVRPLIILSFGSLVSGFPRPAGLKNIFTAVLLYLPLAFLIFRQPDLGSSIVVTAGFVGVIIASGIKPKHLLFGLIGLLVMLPVGSLGLHDYQKHRLITFINPYTDPLGKGYNAIQSVIAVGSGGLFGRGLGRGTQSQLRFLPESHTDFIFSSLAEELGLFGSLILISAYFVLYLKIFKTGAGSQNKFVVVTCFGILSLLQFQTILNIGMNIGLAPITGVTLPLVSYGGSSLLSTMVLLSIVQSLHQTQRETPNSLLIN